MHLRFDSGDWGVRADLSAAIGYGSQSDLIGLVLMPFYELSNSFQLVGRYSYIHSFDDNGVRLGRYENRIEQSRGDQYDEVYVGLNWLPYGHKFKLQTGLKYTWMDGAADDGGDYRGWPECPSGAPGDRGRRERRRT